MKPYQQYLFLSLALMLTQVAKADVIYISGSTTVQNYIQVAAQAYQEKHPDTEFLISGGGSTSGFGNFIDGRNHIGMMSRELTKKEQQLFVDHQAVTIAWDAVVPVVSKKVFIDEYVTTISIDALRGIYQGSITNWQQVGGANKPILVVDKTSYHGTRYVFARYILGSAIAPHLTSSIILEDNQDVLNIVSSSDQTLAYLSNTYKDADVYALALDINGKIIQATDEHIRSGNYPLSRPLLLLVAQEIPNNIQGFIDFILSPEGQALVKQVGYTSIQ